MSESKKSIWKASDAFWAVAAIFLFASLFLVPILAYRQGKANRNWVTTKGTIISSDVEVKTFPTREGDKIYHEAKVKYEYTVVHKKYIGDQVASGKDMIAEATVKEYPPGKKVTVYYNPNNHSEAVLETGVKWDNYRKLFWLSVFVFILTIIPIIVRVREIMEVISLNRYIDKRHDQQRLDSDKHKIDTGIVIDGANVFIQHAGSDDVDEILQVQKLAYHSEAELYNDFNIEPLTQTVEDVLAEMRDKIVLKAVLGSRIIGSVRAGRKGDTCLIGKLIVHPDFQNRGLGKRLLKEIEDEFVDAPRYELGTGHLSEKNLSLYGKLGYREIRTEKVTDTLTFVIMEKL